MSYRHPGMAVALRCLFVATVLLFLGGCQDLREGGLENREAGEFLPSEGGYPHPEGWADPLSHGVWAVEFGSGACLECHVADPGAEEIRTACFNCHPLFPHKEGWVQKENHGEEVRTNGLGACATQCHGTDLQGGLSGVSCRSCHNAYPHPEGWEDQHGSTMLTLGKPACQGCHGDDFKTVLDGKNCYSCHNYPHPDPASWIPFTGGHGEKLKTTYGGSTTDCEKCHGSDLKTLKEGKNCFTCHPSYLHSKMAGGPWKEYGGHGQYALPPSKKPECRLCHGDDYKGGSRGNPSCFTASCHASYPHLEGWRRPPGESQEHGNYVNLNTTASCATARCHGAGLVPAAGTTNGPSCDGCHDPYPHPTDWAPPTTPSLHGPVARSAIAKCKVCHGDGLDVAPVGSQTCKGCHLSYLSHDSAQMPAVPVGWWKSLAGHGTFLKDKGWDASECRACHGADYLGGISLVSCKSSGCHASYPHDAPGWNGYAGHGIYVLSTLGNVKTPCKLCHGSDLKGGTSAKSCYACHNGVYPHDATWALPANHGVAAYGTGKNNCNSANCHKASFLGGAPAGPPAGPPVVKSCKESLCHADFPHTDPNWRTGALGLAGNVHASAFAERMDGDGIGDDPLACQECHGAGYHRVVPAAPTIDCEGCHSGGVTHKTGWKTGPGHGTYYSITRGFISTSEPYCKDCHGHPSLAVPTFTAAQTKLELAGQSDCYKCHWAYPHVGYTGSGTGPEPGCGPWVGGWAPGGGDCTEGHFHYLGENPLFTDSANTHPTDWFVPLNTAAIKNTCGSSTAGSCHGPPPVAPVGTVFRCNYCHSL